MNAHAPQSITAATFDIGEGAYIMSEADFPDGCTVITDSNDGRRFGWGRNKLGIEVTVELGRWLCNTCDQALDNGVCHDCRQVFDVGNVVPIGGQTWRVEL
jgi:hypothetical protein